MEIIEISRVKEPRYGCCENKLCEAWISVPGTC